jgi:NTE family protein
MDNNKKIGLALGGGAIFGAAHIGVLKVIDELNIPIKLLSGTSAGALVASLYAFGKTWEEIQDIALDMSWFSVSELSLSRFAILSNEKIGAIIEKNIGKVKIENAEIPLSIVATNISSGAKVVIKEGDLAEAVKASTCIPGIFSPVKYNDELLIDGGIVENVPLKTLLDMGAETAIGVDLNAGHAIKKPENVLEVLLNTFNFMMMNVTKLQEAEDNILIKPKLHNFNLVDEEQVPDLIEAGYKEAKAVLEKLY